MTMLNAQIAARAIINAWDGWTDEAANASDNILQAAAGYARALLLNAPHQIPDGIRPEFFAAVAVITDEPAPGTAHVPNLTFDEAIAPLREFAR